MEERKAFTITLIELLVILLVFVLSRVVAEPWILASQTIYFSLTGHSPTSALHVTYFALSITAIIVVILILIDLFALFPEGTKSFFKH